MNPIIEKIKKNKIDSRIDWVIKSKKRSIDVCRENIIFDDQKELIYIIKIKYYWILEDCQWIKIYDINVQSITIPYEWVVEY